MENSTWITIWSASLHTTSNGCHWSMVQVDSTQVDICLVCGERSLVVWVDQLATWHFMYLVLIQLLQSFLALHFICSWLVMFTGSCCIQGLCSHRPSYWRYSPEGFVERKIANPPTDLQEMESLLIAHAHVFVSCCGVLACWYDYFLLWCWWLGSYPSPLCKDRPVGGEPWPMPQPLCGTIKVTSLQAVCSLQHCKHLQSLAQRFVLQ